MHKGMSQTLALIVTASVLMMTALTVIFLTQGSLSGIGEQSTWNSCRSTVETQCNIKGQGATVAVPSSCKVENANGESQVMQKARNTFQVTGDDRITCQ